MDLLKRPLEDYIRHRFGAEATFEKETRQTRGSSRATWFVDLRPQPGAPLRSVVFRSDPPGGSTIPTSLEREYFIYDRLGRSDVPVAKTLFWEDDPKWATRPFYVREQIEGSWEIPHFSDPDPQYDALRIAISKEHLRKLAMVHQIDWRALGFDEHLSAPKNEAECAAHFIDMMMAQLNEFQQEPIPLIVEAVGWLKARAPVAGRISLCKGTNGLGEEVFRDGVIVALSDWEEASIGDPAADFAWLQNFIPEIERDGEKLWGLEQAVAFYREVSGIDVTVDSVRYYHEVRALSTILFGHKAAVVTHQSKGATIRQAWTGTEVVYLGKRGLAAAMGLAPPIDFAWFAEMNETVS